ncbi:MULTISPECIES: HEAT repeat domain-containing protein [Microbacterium]|uniref:HEAT repeat domain-containing protein n=1 Tax=Microbacterium TaxID=33882 RepID=UPI0027890142|nr:MULTISPECIES: HEAT repeat domain-containing protein [Microbacterium]MDQ1084849.1 hypothetical protein [Microbacterium sp. SORGH_AS_0344]MDQ1169871.1 hypothetical protein [Microbacterium proteolyticum]
MISPDEAELVARLGSLGYDVEHVSDLRHLGVRYDDAYPFLLSALQSTDDESLREWCIRSLSLPWIGDDVVDVLVDQFLKTSRNETRGEWDKWTIGNALWYSWRDSYFDTYRSLAEERQYGRSREMIVLGFEKTRLKSQAVPVLLGLLNDETVSGHAVSALAKLGQEEARSALEEASTDSRRWVRNAAKRGVVKLDKLAAKRRAVGGDTARK